MNCKGIGSCQDQGCPAHYAAEDYMRDKFEQLVRDTCHTDEYTFKLNGGAYFRTTYAKTYDGLPPREMASVQTLWTFYQAGAAHQRQQAREVVMPERKVAQHGDVLSFQGEGWNACLDEIARLNGKEESCKR